MTGRLPALLMLLLALTPSLARGQGVDTLAIRGHTRFLASDLLEGRGTGSRGQDLAALYLASQLQRMGIPGAGPDGSHFQAVPLREAHLDHASSRVVVQRGSDTIPFAGHADFVIVGGGPRAFDDFGGDAIFAGTAALAGTALAGQGRLDGRVIVLLGTLGGLGQERIPDWIERGAAGVVSLLTDEEQYRRYRQAMGESRYFVDAAVDDPIWQGDLPILVAGPRLAAALLAGAPIPSDALSGARPFDAVNLDRSVRASTVATIRELPGANVAGLVRGHDPARRDEIVAYVAHYDHLGIGAPDARGDSIYNGFSDNAAGVAMVLAIAETFQNEPPARSVLFLFFTGEERGLLGSSYYAAHPLIPLERTVALINLDAGAPPAPPRDWHLAGGSLSTLGEVGRRVAARRGWKAEPSEGRPNSDHWPFLRRNVPAIFIIPGQDWEGVDRAERQRLVERWERYHQAGDHWAADFPFAGLGRYAELALAIGREVADAPDRPRMIP